MIVVLLGAPGVGKGTQAKLLADKHHLSILSTGEILREAIKKKKTDLGTRVEKTINKGALVDDKTICSLVDNKLISQSDNCIGSILDGFPRTIEQAKKLNNTCSKYNLGRPCIIMLYLSEKEIVRRLSARIYCSDCNQNYNLITNPTKIRDICDQCSGQEFYVRKDDQLEAVQLRLRSYSQQTKPLTKYYSLNKNYHVIQASEKIEIIHSKVSTVIKEFLK